eukprot:CAMPEP_0177630008 /NCGR_PEP_ID=MMETSP0447-20121125/979_1 /TAXON_ID=0 /ORGANISM="Stygamoeba regulata, Strain BSH-02190019" /LENGTH=397 /DNA_ID=CAMNT_0019131381 /DNA_START=643 /DNA_END=1833 /DNA_ORIENTATION=+
MVNHIASLRKLQAPLQAQLRENDRHLLESLMHFLGVLEELVEKPEWVDVGLLPCTALNSQFLICSLMSDLRARLAAGLAGGDGKAPGRVPALLAQTAHVLPLLLAVLTGGSLEGRTRPDALSPNPLEVLQYVQPVVIAQSDQLEALHDRLAELMLEAAGKCLPQKGHTGANLVDRWDGALTNTPAFWCALEGLCEVVTEAEGGDVEQTKLQAQGGVTLMLTQIIPDNTVSLMTYASQPVMGKYAALQRRTPALAMLLHSARLFWAVTGALPLLKLKARLFPEPEEPGKPTLLSPSCSPLRLRKSLPTQPGPQLLHCCDDDTDKDDRRWAQRQRMLGSDSTVQQLGDASRVGLIILPGAACKAAAAGAACTPPTAARCMSDLAAMVNVDTGCLIARPR